MAKTQVLIVGAGPTGLYLAHELARRGVSVRLIDKAPEPGPSSRAVVVQARTLELYRQSGLADEVVARGLKFMGVNLWSGGVKRAHVPFGDIGIGLSPYPFGLIYPQDEHEAFLIERLKALGVEVERPIELVGFDDYGDMVEARLRHADGPEEIVEADWIAGCDGAHSTVRETLRMGFPGGTYSHLFYVADIRGSGPMIDGELHIAIDTADFLGVFPLKGKGRARLIGALRREDVDRLGSLSWEDVNPAILNRLKLEVAKVNWFSTYHVHHRVAGRFRAGRAFLLGDAAHIHSPVGGQGMNTGLGDAANLAWKLAAVIGESGDERLLDSYDQERVRFAHRLVKTTDQLFTVASSTGGFARAMRTEVVPAVVPPLFKLEAVRRFIFRTASQTSVDYRGGFLSAGGAGMVRGGDRLPWVAPEDGAADNFSVLDGVGWQAHVYGSASAEIEAACGRRGVPIHVFEWSPNAGRAGLMRNALYLVRPDGYVGLCDPNARTETLCRYLDLRGLRKPKARKAAPRKSSPRKAAARRRSADLPT